jgi:predicted lipoprotein with Yx(FWY)xxD motif
MCAGIRSQLGVYLTGAIAPADRAAVVRHLAACADCRAELAGLAALPALLRRPPVRAAALASPDDEAAADDARADDARADDARADDARADGEGADGEGEDGEDADGEFGPAGDAVPGRLIRRTIQARRRRRWLLAAAALALAATAVTGWALYLTSPPAPGPATAATVLDTRTVDGVTVLTDAEGYTLYWFGPDTARWSACQGTCARNWPPVTGPASWQAGATGTIGAIARSDGSLQATYDGHPLYTTTADTAPGQAKGDGVWSHGGQWHEVAVTGPGRGD